MAPPSRKSQPKNLRNPSRKAAISKGNRFRRTVSSQKLPLQLEDDAPDFPRGFILRLQNSPFKLCLVWLSMVNQQKKNVSPGMKLWGVIAEVNEKDIVVILPGGLRGLVRACEAFDPILGGDVEQDAEKNFFSSLYSGQLVSCIVMQVDDDKKEIANRKIWLSLHLSLLHKGLTLDIIQEGMVLSAYVKSIEDHGFILHFGCLYFAGFMSKHSNSEKGSSEARVGQILQGVVRSVDRARKVLHMDSDPDVVSKCVTKELKGGSLDLLIRGMMVNARVQSTLENGIMLSFLIYFTGTLVRIGDIFDQSKVIRVDKGSGLLLETPTLPVPTPIYVNVTDVADKEVQKLEKNFKEGSLVRVRVVLGFRCLEGLATGILKVDERNRVSLGMKKSYFKDEEPLQQSLDDDVEKIGSMVVAGSKTLLQSSSASIKNSNLEVESGYHSMLADFENRALVPPLEVPLDDIEIPNNEVDVDHVPNSAEIIEGKNKRAKKKAREEREQEIRAAEERLLGKDIPKSTDEFEKLVRSSPNSSFIWIKYMEFMLSLADVEKARSIAERALRIINIREESEKLNIWVAYFNLENEYGNPPEECYYENISKSIAVL